MSEKLKSCPFCSGEVEIRPFANPRFYFSINCKVCGVNTNYFKDATSFNKEKSEKENAKINKQKTIEAWNARAAEKNLTDAVNEIINDLESSADACNEHGDLILVEHAIRIIKEYLLTEEEIKN